MDPALQRSTAFPRLSGWGVLAFLEGLSEWQCATVYSSDLAKIMTPLGLSVDKTCPLCCKPDLTSTVKSDLDVMPTYTAQVQAKCDQGTTLHEPKPS